MYTHTRVTCWQGSEHLLRHSTSPAQGQAWSEAEGAGGGFSPRDGLTRLREEPSWLPPPADPQGDPCHGGGKHLTAGLVHTRAFIPSLLQGKQTADKTAGDSNFIPYLSCSTPKSCITQSRHIPHRDPAPHISVTELSRKFLPEGHEVNYF